MKKLNEMQTTQLVGGSSAETYSFWAANQPQGADTSYQRWCGIIGAYSLQPVGSFQYLAYWNEYTAWGYLDTCNENDW